MARQRENGKMIPLPIGGMFAGSSVTDPASIPDGMCTNVVDVVYRDGSWQSGPSWTSTATLGSKIVAMPTWQDLANATTRLVGVHISFPNTTLYVQDVGANTFTAGPTFANTAYRDATNYRGRLFISGDTSIYAFDGTNLTTDALGGESLYADTLTTFIDRIFLGRVRATVTNQLTVAQSYDPTSSWATSNVTAEKITNGTTIVGRITPTNDTTASLYLKDIYTVAAATTDTFLRYWCDLRNTSAVYAVPVKIEAYYSQAWVAGTAYSLGSIRVPTVAGGNGYRYRCTVAGTADAVTEPTWPTTVGSIVTDNTVTWICDGTDACGSLETTIANISDEPNFTRNSVLVRVAPNPQSTKIGIRIVFGNTGSTTYTLTSLEMSLRDGKTDGDLNKQNRGQQLTIGRFGYDFFNQESSATATVTYDDRIYWTETADSNDVRGNNYYRCQESAGAITAVRTYGNRLVVFKRRGAWVFSGTADPDIPLRLERFYANIGCSGPQNIAFYNDVIYFVGANDVYAWKIGADPVPLGGAAMRSTLFQSSTIQPRSLAVHAAFNELWLVNNQEYGTNGKYYDIYNIANKTWTRGTQTFAGVVLGYGLAYSEATDKMILFSSRTVNGLTYYEVANGARPSFTPKYLAASPNTDIFVKYLHIRAANAATATINVTAHYRVGGTQLSTALTGEFANATGTIPLRIPVFLRGDQFGFDISSPSGITPASVIAECDIISAIPSV